MNKEVVRTGKHQILLLFIVIISSVASAQPPSPPEKLDYKVEEFVLPGGRLGNNVNDIVQGPNGFMWFGSHGGIHRYDGYEFITYRGDPSDTVGETTSLTYPYVEGLYWDSEDKLWIMTWGNGLYRFDPITGTFKHYGYDPNDSTGISGPLVTCAMEDAEGRLWFGTTGGLNRFDRQKETFTRYHADPEDPGSIHYDEIRKLYLDSKGTLWIGTGFARFVPNTGALSRYVPETDSFINYTHDPENDNSLPSPAVRGILEDSKGNFWIGTTLGLSKMDRNTGTFEQMIPGKGEPFAPGTLERQDPAVYSILEDQRGGVWVGTIMGHSYSSHLIRFDAEKNDMQVYPVESSVWDIHESRDGTIWVAGAGVSGKVLRISPKAKHYDLFRGENVFEEFFQSSYRRDFLGSGLTHMNGPSGLVIDPETGNYWLEYVISSTVTDSTVVTLINYNPDQNSAEFHPLHELSTSRGVNLTSTDPQVNKLFMDDSGRIWGSPALEDIGIYSYDPETRRVEHYPHDPGNSTSLSSNTITDMIMDRKGDVWAATYENGLNRINIENGSIKHYKFGADIGGDIIYSLMEDVDGNIWVAGEIFNDGYFKIIVIDPDTDNIRKVDLPYPGSFMSIQSMVQSLSGGTIVFSLLNDGIGQYYMNPEGEDAWIFLNKEEGFPVLNVADIIVDDEGIFWIADAESNLFLRLREFNDFVFRSNADYPADIRSGYYGPDGNIYFLSSTGRGWMEIDPGSVIPETGPGPTEIKMTDLYIMGQKQLPGKKSSLPEPLWMLDKITLPSDAGSFGIRFSDFNYRDHNPSFRYRLIPYESNWRSSGNSPYANYYKIPPGTYQIQVSSQQQQGNLDANVSVMEVTILPPWYKTGWAYSIYGLILILGIVGVHRFQKARTIRKEQERIKDRELEQAKKIEKAYAELKATQQQLIHSEKMASLGELTAGIAHEIQNPLNFVNNFSEVSDDLIDEMLEDLAEGNEKEVREIISDLRQNLGKINNHGKRASEIVKAMLQHSRGSEGKKEPTDINALCDEYLRLAFHGIRAKDKSFNAEYELELDPNLPKINVIPQDIGRVLLNLINNAFYAVDNKAKSGIDEYKPEIIVMTKKNQNSVEISVKDNGDGVPEHIKDKIFQPFFTTKPTGQGTGLGLSLSYDIVTKGHNGALRVETKQGEGTEFIIELPAN